MKKKNFNNLDTVKSWKFRPTKEDNEVMKESLSKEDKELLEREIEEIIVSKELKAFKRFRDNIRWIEENTSLKTYFEIDDLHFKEDLDIIETALNRLEELEKENKKLKTSNKVYKRNHEQELIYIDELRKVLKIIKEKRVNIGLIKEKECSLEIYNKKMLLKKWRLTETEFNLLKEVLK